MSIEVRKGRGGGPRQAGFAILPELRKPWVARFAVKDGRTIPVVRTRLSLSDRLGWIRMRWDIGRMDYRVLPGLYAAGDPGRDSDVFVSANYKMSFDALRSGLAALYALPADASWPSRALPMFLALAGVWPVGTLAFPALLPWLPTRSFAVKGAFLGLLWGLGAGILGGLPALGLVAAVLVAMPLTAFLAMNFTGSSAFTCQPGARLEVEKGFWPMVAFLATGLASGIASRLFGI